MSKTFYTALLIFITLSSLMGQGDGLLINEGRQVFPIGWYNLPGTESELRELADEGINLIRCDSKEALDRLKAVGMQGWMPIKMEDGVSEDLKKQVLSVASHPALAVWEGPDEVVWNFTAWSGLYLKKKVHSIPDAWWAQTTEAIEYADQQAAIVIPNIQRSVEYIRSVDPFNRQIWINEASSSDATFVRRYIGATDITGCDYYPVTESLSPEGAKIRNGLEIIGNLTERYCDIGNGKPVWMILQAFSWHELGDQYSNRPVAYPSFSESRFMAYDAIAHGSKGIIYWGAEYCKSKTFLQSLFALTRELSSLQTFLAAPEQTNITASAISGEMFGVQKIDCIARQYSRDWMIAVINETDKFQMGVVVKGLKNLNDIKFNALYTSEELTVENEELVIRLNPFEVKVLTTGKKWETNRLSGREYPGM